MKRRNVFNAAILGTLAVAAFFALIGPRAAHAAEFEGQSDILVVASRTLGQGNFTGMPGAWCAWAVSAWLRATGRKPLPNGMAASALSYGPRVAHPKPGDIVVMRRHVGIVVADLGNEIQIVSGNWSHRVALAFIPRRSVVAFIAV